ncbi:hypothetical protein MY1884_008051 [Beauveria asiatica]
MQTTLALVFLGLLNVAYSSSTRVLLRDCKPGKLVCHGESQYGLCDIDNTVSFMDTAEGTSCVCSGTECSIIFTAGSDTETPALPSSQSDPGPDAPTQTSQQTSLVSASKFSDASAATSGSLCSAGISEGSPVDASVANAQPLSKTNVPASVSTSSKPNADSGTNTGGISGGRTYIKTFVGNGEPTSGWPAQWIDFDSMWMNNLDNVISQSCNAFRQANNSDLESADVKSAIENVAQSSGVDKRFILAIALQESGCCVRAPPPTVALRCPKDSIQGMIADGVTGTPSGDGLAQILSKVGSSDVSRYYKAARMYNSGSIAPSGLLEDGGSTHCYASDIANRLIGWSHGPKGCRIS